MQGSPCMHGGPLFMQELTTYCKQCLPLHAFFSIRHQAAILYIQVCRLYNDSTESLSLMQWKTGTLCRYCLYIGGWGAELNREIVSCRACVRAVCMSSEFGAKKCGRPLSLFPFRPERFSLFPSPAPQSPIQLQLALSVHGSAASDQ